MTVPASRTPRDGRGLAGAVSRPHVSTGGHDAGTGQILPAIFPYYVTGGIGAAGGAWNASIMAEYVTYGKTPLIAHGQLYSYYHARDGQLVLTPAAGSAVG